MRLQRPWKVPIHMPRVSMGRRACRRAIISRAALLVNVTARMVAGDARPCWMSHAIRVMRTRVLPLPAPARISAGSFGSVTAACCSGFRLASRSGIFWEDGKCVRHYMPLRGWGFFGGFCLRGFLVVGLRRRGLAGVFACSALRFCVPAAVAFSWSVCLRRWPFLGLCACGGGLSLVCVPTALAFPWSVCLRRWPFLGLCAYGVGLSLICHWSISVAPVRGGTLTFFAAAKKDKQRKRLEAPAK